MLRLGLPDSAWPTGFEPRARRYLASRRGRPAARTGRWPKRGPGGKQAVAAPAACRRACALLASPPAAFALCRVQADGCGSLRTAG